MNLGHCDLAMSGVLSSGLRNENAACHRFGLLRLKKTSRKRGRSPYGLRPLLFLTSQRQQTMGFHAEMSRGALLGLMHLWVADFFSVLTWSFYINCSCMPV